MKSAYCVYTVLLGDYEDLQNLNLHKSGNIDYICLTDNNNLFSEHWQIRIIDPVFPTDIPRSSRHPKILANLYLQEYEISLYVDNSVKITSDPFELFERFACQSDVLLALNHHSFHNSLWMEFSKVKEYQLDNLERVNEQLNTYIEFCPDILDEKPFWGGFILRRHNDPNVIKTMEAWWLQVVRYSRRDQLSLNYCLNLHPLNLLNLELDLHKSKYHQWPVFNRRERKSYTRNIKLSNLNLHAQVRELKFEISNQDKNITELIEENNDLKSSALCLENQIKDLEECINYQKILLEVPNKSRNSQSIFFKKIKEFIKYIKRFDLN